MTSTTPAATAWARERNRLIGIAYRMLGDYGAAEDVVSDVAVEALRAERGATGGGGAAVSSWPAWLTTVCVRRSIDRLRHLQSLREEYPGPWLPEPVATGRLPDEVVADRELLSLTVLHLAEQLAPETRAAIVLHRAFGMSAPEIAPLLDSTPAAVRQSISRGERRLQLDPDSPLVPTSAAALRAAVTAIERGDIDAVISLLADDAVLWTDGGGRVKSALNPVFGVERIRRFFRGVLERASRAADPWSVRVIDVNGEPALSLHLYGLPDVLAFEYRDGLVRGIRRISNPEKLHRAFEESPKTR